MVTALRAVVLAGLLFLPSQRSATAVQASGDTTALEFLGFRAGARLEELNLRLRNSSGSLRCRQSRADRRVSECRGALRQGKRRAPGRRLGVGDRQPGRSHDVVRKGGFGAAGELAGHSAKPVRQSGHSGAGHPAYAAVGAPGSNDSADLASGRRHSSGIGESGGRTGAR